MLFRYPGLERVCLPDRRSGPGPLNDGCSLDKALDCALRGQLLGEAVTAPSAIREQGDRLMVGATLLRRRTRS